MRVSRYPLCSSSKRDNMSRGTSAVGKIIAISAMLSLAIVACAATNQHDSKPRASATVPAAPNGEVIVGAGIACSRDGIIGPPSYAVRDLGKTGVPHLQSRDLRMLHEIMRYVHPSTLRFVYLRGRLAIFDAEDGPCYSGQYPVLNARWCNEIFVPADADGRMFAGPGGCWAHPRPWIPNDGGNPSAPPWTQYDNSH